MYDSAIELLDKIKLGEDSTLEFKQVRFRGSKLDSPSPSDLGDELAAFGNWCDGVCILGIEDKTREITGIPADRLDSVEELVRNVVNDHIKPALPVRIAKLELPDSGGTPRAVIKIDIPRSLFVHASPGGYYFRQGSSKRKMPPDLLGRLFQQRSQARLIRFDEQVVPETSIQDFDDRLAARFKKGEGEEIETSLRKLGLLREDDQGATRATVGGILFCSNDPTSWLRNAYVDAVAYKGTERSPNYQLDAKRITGPLDRQIDEAWRFCLRNSRVEAHKGPARTETPQFSERALFEAIVNAVAHRDYSISVSHIRLSIYDNRLELCSPGSLPNTMTVESIDRRQATRNELIASVLARVPIPETNLDLKRTYMMDKRGWGVPAILEESERLSGKRPVYEVVDESEVILTIYAAGSVA